jgi:hypothetical protein
VLTLDDHVPQLVTTQEGDSYLLDRASLAQPAGRSAAVLPGKAVSAGRRPDRRCGMSQIVWAAWHPRHGYEIPGYYEGAIAFADLDDAVAPGAQPQQRRQNQQPHRLARVKTMLVRAP